MKVQIILLLLVICTAGKVKSQSGVDDFLSSGDSAYAVHNHEKAFEFYQQALEMDSTDYDAAWKLSRAAVDIGETMDEEPRMAYYRKGVSFARKAVNLDSTGSKGHLWLSIALGRVALDESPKERIRLAREIKKEVDLAIQYDPTDDIAYHVLGRWNRRLANLSWIEKTYANIFLGGIPEEATEENAVKNFMKAIELNPQHINHYLELGITYELMGEDEQARTAYRKCLELPLSDSDDERHKTEAAERLEDL